MSVSQFLVEVYKMIKLRDYKHCKYPRVESEHYCGNVLSLATMSLVITLKLSVC